MVNHLRANYYFQHNEVTGHIELRKVGDQHYLNFNDKMLNNIWCNLQQDGIKVRRDDLRTIIHSDHSPYYNPFIDYFTTLPAWDGETDYIASLADTIEVDPNAL